MRDYSTKSAVQRQQSLDYSNVQSVCGEDACFLLQASEQSGHNDRHSRRKRDYTSDGRMIGGLQRVSKEGITPRGGKQRIANRRTAGSQDRQDRQDEPK